MSTDPGPPDSPSPGSDVPEERETVIRPRDRDPGKADPPGEPPMVAGPGRGRPRSSETVPGPSPRLSGFADVRHLLGESDPGLLDQRFQASEVLGRGGMGEVRLVHDQVIGRNVAMKRILSATDEKGFRKELFFREVQLQGRLEHPSIVPLYEFGVDAGGRPFFTMKRVTGVTLAEAMWLARESTDGAERYPPRRLMAALAQASLAVEYAHRQGVIHRDLKPANIMLGEFGEVYVLDWGLAGHGRLGIEAAMESGESPKATQVPLGTPGYAPPEQVDQEPERVGPESDVWALGAILFEILADEPFVPGETVTRVLDETYRERDPRPSSRRHDLDVPPELDAICERSLSVNPRRRYPSARDFHDDLDGYLAGERDVEVRREAAERHAQDAEDETSRALTLDSKDALASRRRALRAVNRALALDPANERALDCFVRMIQTPPAFTPDEVEKRIEAAHLLEVRKVARVAGLASLVGLVMASTGGFVLDILAPWHYAAALTLTASTAIYGFFAAREGRGGSRRHLRVGDPRDPELRGDHARARTHGPGPHPPRGHRHRRGAGPRSPDPLRPPRHDPPRLLDARRPGAGGRAPRELPVLGGPA